MNINLTKYIAPALLLGALALPATAQTPPPPPFHHPTPINARFRDQQARIHQGVKSGQLTRREQYRLEARDSRIRTQEYRDKLSGGRFTAAERHHIQRELNHSSAAIYRDKHNDHTR